MTAAISIRAATPADQDMLTALIAASYASLGAGQYETQALAAALPYMSRANPKLLACGTYYVLEVAGEPSACGGWTKDMPGSGQVIEGVAHIRHFATHPAHLRKGLARILLHRCLEEARAARFKEMMSQSTLPAQTFYAAAGFRPIRPIEVEMGPGIMLPAVEMRLDL